MRNGKALFLSLFLLFLTAGCSLHSPEELYTLPEPPAEYKNLDNRIQETMTSLGAEYAPPLGGTNTQTVQLIDLDGDGVDEAIAFFRIAGDPKPLKIYIFRQDEKGLYYANTVIEGEGTAIQSIAYANLGKSAAAELVVSWRMSDKVHTLAAYDLHPGGATELMRTGYSDYELLDIDMDNEMEIVVLQLDLAGGKSRAELYNYQNGGMVLSAAAPLSYDVRELVAVRAGYLRDNVQALFVSSTFGEANGQLTDIFAWRNGTLENITMDSETGQSRTTMQFYHLVSISDIDQDGIMEVPSPSILPSVQKTPAVDFWTINWKQFDVNGQFQVICTTYHNLQDRWYLTLPEQWAGQLVLYRRDNAVNGERAVVFSRWTGGETDPVPFLTIYKLTGINRQARSRLGNRFVLSVQPDTIFAAEFYEVEWDCGLDQESLADSFHLIRSEWSSEY